MAVPTVPLALTQDVDVAGNDMDGSHDHLRQHGLFVDGDGKVVLRITIFTSCADGICWPANCEDEGCTDRENCDTTGWIGALNDEYDFDEEDTVMPELWRDHVAEKAFDRGYSYMMRYNAAGEKQYEQDRCDWRAINVRPVLLGGCRGCLHRAGVLA